MTDAVRQAILEPMLQLYLPPLHLRADAQAQALALALYEQALAPFDRGTLERAWQQVVAHHAFWVWPNPGLIAEACRHCESRPRPPSDEEQRQAQALELAEAYTTRYLKTSQLAKLAKREGWAGWLRDYVAAAAWVQAQLICRVRNIGWDGRLAQDLGRFHSSGDAFEAYRQTIIKPVERGQIRVHVPPSRIHRWKVEAVEAADRPQPTDGPAAEGPPPSPLNWGNTAGTPVRAR
jgi:hypothetical protein